MRGGRSVVVDQVAGAANQIRRIASDLVQQIVLLFFVKRLVRQVLIEHLLLQRLLDIVDRQVVECQRMHHRLDRGAGRVQTLVELVGRRVLHAGRQVTGRVRVHQVRRQAGERLLTRSGGEQRTRRAHLAHRQHVLLVQAVHGGRGLLVDRVLQIRVDQILAIDQVVVQIAGVRRRVGARSGDRTEAVVVVVVQHRRRVLSAEAAQAAVRLLLRSMTEAHRGGQLVEGEMRRHRARHERTAVALLLLIRTGDANAATLKVQLLVAAVELLLTIQWRDAVLTAIAVRACIEDGLVQRCIHVRRLICV